MQLNKMDENNNYIVAIDLGSSNTTLAVGEVIADKLHIVDVEIVPSQGVVNGEIKNMDLVVKAITKAVNIVEERLEIKILEIYAGVSGKHLRCASHPYYIYVSGADGEISEEDVRKLNDNMRSYQAPYGYKILHITPQHYLVNDEEIVENPVGMYGKTLASTFNLVVGDASLTGRVEKALSNVGISQKALYINSVVSAEAVVLPDEKEMGVAVIDIGAGISDICIYHDRIVRYLGVIPMGAGSINKDIRAHGILERYVEGLKIEYGCAVPENVDETKQIKVPGRTSRDPKIISFQNLAAIIEARLKDIADFIKAEIKTAGYEGKLGAGIVITGGCANLKDIDLMLEKYLGMDVRIATPNVMVDEDSMEIASNSSYSTVVGILVEAMNELDSGCMCEQVARDLEPVVGDIDPVLSVEAEMNAANIDDLEESAEDSEVNVDKEKSRVKHAKRKSGFFAKVKENINKYFDYSDQIIDDDN